MKRSNTTKIRKTPSSPLWLYAWLGRVVSICWILTLFSLSQRVEAQSFPFKERQISNVVNSGTALQFGPDGRLYVAERSGAIKIFTIALNSSDTTYFVTDTETLNFVKTIPNHDDDGSPCGTIGNTGGCDSRQVTGIKVVGTAANPVVYVSSSDFRVGAGNNNGDINLDTNSGVITRLTWNGSSWEVVDIVRGLPRSEENHATNGLEFVNIGGDDYLIVCSGGFTNAGSPSNNFAFITEYALSGAVLAVNLNELNALGVKTDPNSGRQYIYDMPTLDDPTRRNVDAEGFPASEDPNDPDYSPIDENDPWGGNDGLNQSKLVVDSPVKMFSPGYRNTYDLVVTQSGAVYVTDNGANGGWGGFPENEGTPQVNNNFRPGEPGSDNDDGDEPKVNNQDHLNLVTTNIQNYTFNSVYGGHPCPIRANANAGLYTIGDHTVAGGYFRTKIYDPNSSDPEAADSTRALPVDWPPVDPSLINVDNADYRSPELNNSTGLPSGNPDGTQDIIIVEWNKNTNAIAEYTASNFDGGLQGDLIAGQNGGNIWRVDIDPSTGDAIAPNPNDPDNKYSTLSSGISGNPLGLTCQGDNDIFPGTIWIANFNQNDIIILVPDDVSGCIEPGEEGYDPLADYDNDGYTNQDEEDNGTDPCNGALAPVNFDSDQEGANKVSDLNDNDDDNDGILDVNDPLQIGEPYDIPVFNGFRSDEAPFAGLQSTGMTGVMNNGVAIPGTNGSQDWRAVLPASDIPGGTSGIYTFDPVAPGDALTNNQQQGYQFGVNASTSTGVFTVEGAISTTDVPNAQQSFGIFIGDGFQDNYLKIVRTNGNTIAVQGENAGIAINNLPSVNAGNLPGGTNLYFVVNPINGTVQAQYSTENTPRTNVGGPISVSGSLLQCIQNANKPLIIGIIANDSDPNDQFVVNYDFINVFDSNPFVSQELPDLQKSVDANSDQIDLDQFFGDDEGANNLTYEASSSDPDITVSVNDNILTINYPSTPDNATITVTATDAGTASVSQSFQVSVSDEPDVVVRINSGGSAYTDVAGNSWVADTPFLDGSINSNAYTNGTIQNTDILNTQDDEIYKTERSGSNGWIYNIPVPEAGTYQVNLHFAEIFFGVHGSGTNNGNPGARVFTITAEGSPLVANYDIIVEAGAPATAIIEMGNVQVNDGLLTLVGTASTNQPKVSGIEVFLVSGGGTPETPISVTPLTNQTNTEGEEIADVQITASGGDGNLDYEATGLPPGLDIEPTLGFIFGTIDGNAATNSPYQVTITVDDSDQNPNDVETFNFQWTVNDAVTINPNPGDIIYRVNAGGSLITDNPTSWEADQAATGGNANGQADPGIPSPFVNSDVNDITFGVNLNGLINNTGYPNAIFATERYSNFPNTANPNQPGMQWDFPVPNGEYTVNLLFAEVWPNISSGGPRIFDVEIEGQLVIDDLNQETDYGFNTAAVESFNVTVTDGNIDIDFIKGVENPNIKGIEIIAGSTTPTEASLTGNFTLQGRDQYDVPLSVKLYPVGETATPAYEFTPTGTAGGQFTITGVVPGTYQVAVKHANYLQVVQTITMIDGNNTATFGELKAGDADGDNFVTALDFSVLVAAFNTQASDTNYNVGADFDGDGFVTALDFSLLVSSFNTAGEEPQAQE